MVEVTIHFGRADVRVQCEHLRGTVHWVTLGETGSRGQLRIFCTTPEAAEALAEAFVKCGARRVNRQVAATNDF